MGSWGPSFRAQSTIFTSPSLRECFVLYPSRSIDFWTVGEEVQLTDGIQHMVDAGLKVFAWELGVDGVRLDIGSPESYWETQNLSFKHLPA